MLLWNVNGLTTSQQWLTEHCVQLHDFLMLTETWTLPDEDAPAIPGFACFSSSREYKHPRAVRGSGGIALYVKSSIAELFELWKVSLSGSILWIKSKQKFLHITGMHHLFIGLVYNAPINSTFETQTSSLPTLDLLQENIADITAMNGLMLIAGDFNARTGEAADALDPDDLSDILDPALQPVSGIPLGTRQSEDKTNPCAFGKVLLNICQGSDIAIMNGRTPGNRSGSFTCQTSKGRSVVDYFLASTQLMHAATSLSVKELPPESDHCPLTLSLHLQAQNTDNPEHTPQVQGAGSDVNLQQIRYNVNKVDKYREALRNLIDPVFGAAAPPDCLATTLQSCISQAALAAFGRPSKHKCQKVEQKWYDAECKAARESLSHVSHGTPEYVSLRKAYKTLIRRKQRAFQRRVEQELCELAHRNPKAFWRSYKERQTQQNNISRLAWKESFQALYKAPTEACADQRLQAETTPVNPLQPESPSPMPASQPTSPDTASDLLNADITHEEVEAALKRLKRNKAAGVDGIRAEFILDAASILLTPLVLTFNQILDKGVPPSWCIGLIHPIFKAGDKNDPGNYRGITVVVILSKLYAMVLEARATAWAEQSRSRAKGQAGFRKDFRTTDQLFIIRTLLQQAAHAKRRLYCCFVDFKKAFDLVPRDILWNVLKRRGMEGRVLTSLQSMYAADKACVFTKDGPSDLFECSIGVKQGCPISPLLFSLYLDELETLLEEASKETDCPRLAELLIAILLFADDIALFSYSSKGLQRQLDILQGFCAKRGLKVNVQKTKTMVFEHQKSQTPAFTYEGSDIEQVENFKYLGMITAYTRTLTPAIDHLCKAATRAMFGLQRRCQQLHLHDPIIKCKLFDMLVKPILCYGCEVWSIVGNKSDLEKLERIQRGFLKRLLGVHMQTTSLHVLAEFGKYPLQLSWQALAGKYLTRLETMATDRLLKQAFIADCRLKPEVSWCRRLEHQLQGHLIPAPTEEQPDRRQFSLVSAQSQHVQQLSLEPSSKGVTYSHIKLGYACEPYIQQANNSHLRRIIAQFRTGSHWLNIETGRHKKLPKQDRTCPLCAFKLTNPGLPPECWDAFDSDDETSGHIEDEHHAIFDCSGYVYAREHFQDLFQSNITTVSQFVNQPKCNQLAKFLTEIRMLRMNRA